MPNNEWIKKNKGDKIWWLDNGRKVKGEFVFSFDKKKKINLFADYPQKLTEAERKTFDDENPFWADFFSDRR